MYGGSILRILRLVIGLDIETVLLVLQENILLILDSQQLSKWVQGIPFQKHQGGIQEQEFQHINGIHIITVMVVGIQLCQVEIQFILGIGGQVWIYQITQLWEIDILYIPLNRTVNHTLIMFKGLLLKIFQIKVLAHIQMMIILVLIGM